MPPFWSDDEIVGYLNEAVQEACERAKLIEDRSSSDVCTLQLQPGTGIYALHSSVLQVKRLTLDGHLLHETSVEELDCEDAGWEHRSGKPRCYVFDPASGAQPPRLRFVAIPTMVGNVAMTVYRGALEPLRSTLLTRIPEVPTRFHERLMDWMYHRAYMKQDAEVFNPQKSADSLALFVQAFGQRPDANVQRKQRDKRPRIVRMRW